MNNTNIFPVMAGSLCVTDKNTVICSVSKKGAISLHSYKIKSKLIPHQKIWFLRCVKFLIFATFYFFLGLNQSFLLLNNEKTNLKNSIKTKKNNLSKEKKNPGNLAKKSSTEKGKKNLKKLGIKFKYFTSKSYVVTTVLIIIAFLCALLIFGYLSTHIGFWIFSDNTSLLVKKFCIGLSKCLIFYLLLITLYLFPAIKNFYKFNTAGNIVLNKENDKLKNHRATNYLNFVIFSLLLSYLVISLIGLNVSPWIKPLANFGIMLICFSVSYELLNLLDSKWIKFKRIILITSWLITSKPAKTELQAVRTALYEGDLMLENISRELTNEQTAGNIALSYIYSEIKDKLLQAGIKDKDEADWLIASYLNVPKLEIKFINSISKQQYKDLQKILSRRLKGEPIAKIFEYTEFYGLKIRVNKYVLTPRQETELLAEYAIKGIGENNFNVLDLCTGSGAIALAISKNTNANVFASDLSTKALEIAKENALSNGVKVDFKQSDLFQNFKKKNYFDIIVSNPPYIKTEDINSLQTEVKDFDPIIALDGGFDGLYFYKKIIKEAPNYLMPKGKIFLEVGFDQSLKVKKLLTEGFINIKIAKDYYGINRIVIAERKPEEPKKRKFFKKLNAKSN